MLALSIPREIIPPAIQKQYNGDNENSSHRYIRQGKSSPSSSSNTLTLEHIHLRARRLLQQQNIQQLHNEIHGRINACITKEIKQENGGLHGIAQAWKEFTEKIKREAEIFMDCKMDVRYITESACGLKSTQFKQSPPEVGRW